MTAAIFFFRKMYKIISFLHNRTYLIECENYSPSSLPSEQSCYSIFDKIFITFDATTEEKETEIDLNIHRKHDFDELKKLGTILVFNFTKKRSQQIAKQSSMVGIFYLPFFFSQQKCIP